jgi:hypothetical protein
VIIETYRGAGDRSGEPITEPLLADDALIHRGRAEMDAHAHQVTETTLDIVFRPGLRLGQLIEAADPAAAAPYRAKIAGVSITVRPASIETGIEVERPA